jgi:hypothetical protein
VDHKELKRAITNAINNHSSKSFGRILKFSYPSLLCELEKATAAHAPSHITEQIYILLKEAPTLCSRGNKPKFDTFEKGYRQFCGPKTTCQCSREHQVTKLQGWHQNLGDDEKAEIKAKSVQTNLAKYGVSNPMKNTVVKAAAAQRNVQKHGVKCAFERPDVREKIKKTNLDRYGIETPFKNPQVQQKARDTYKEKYGGLMVHARAGAYAKYEGKNPFAVDSVKEKRSATMLKKYGTSHALQNKQIFDKMTASNIEKYGRPNPAQFHFSSDLWDVINNKEQFAQLVAGKNSVQVANLLNTRSDLILGYARRHGVLDQMNFSPRSAMEDDLAQWLTQQSIPFKRNDKKVLQGLELDILFPDHGVAIELNGLYHHSELAGHKDSKYHWHKTKGCEIKGVQLLHVWQDEYWAKKEIIHSKILYLTNQIKNRIYARNCVISPLVPVAEEISFVDSNHIQGFADYRQWSMGAWHNNMLVGVMSFAHRKGRLELVRYATSIDQVCVGLFSKLFSHSVKQFGFSGKIISQSDNRISNGNLYLSAGWQYEGEQAPAYCYTGDYLTRLGKERFMKSRIAKKFDLDPARLTSLTEWEIMQDIGYDRLWDAGKKVWSRTV